MMDSLYLGKCSAEEFKTSVGRIGELEYYRLTPNVNITVIYVGVEACLNEYIQYVCHHSIANTLTIRNIPNNVVLLVHRHATSASHVHIRRNFNATILVIL